mmetsp:Transcript_57900/g.91995  ORF Transcript_57900/g.91995 Transcript_57900/m.91995 type:complete len:162 (-) Transcript_57900:19-504(-)
MECEEDWETYSDKTILRAMLNSHTSLENAPEQTGKRFKESEHKSLLPGLLRDMLRPNTHTFQFVKAGIPSEANAITSENRLALEAVLKHRFCQAALDNDRQLHREVDAALSRKQASKRLFSETSEDVDAPDVKACRLEAEVVSSRSMLDVSSALDGAHADT